MCWVRGVPSSLSVWDAQSCTTCTAMFRVSFKVCWGCSWLDFFSLILKTSLSDLLLRLPLIPSLAFDQFHLQLIPESVFVSHHLRERLFLVVSFPTQESSAVSLSLLPLFESLHQIVASIVRHLHPSFLWERRHSPWLPSACSSFLHFFYS